MKAADALTAHDERLLDLLRAGVEHTKLRELVQERDERVQSLAAALGRGERLSAEEVRRLLQQERELHHAVAQRRDHVAGALALLYHARRAGKRYHGEADWEPKFVDRSG